MNVSSPESESQERTVIGFNDSFRREFLDVYLFESLDQVREMAWVWMMGYNEERPYESLEDLRQRFIIGQKASE